MEIKFIAGKVICMDLPLCTIGQVEAARDIVRQNTPDLYGRIPQDHIWGGGKLDHVGILHEKTEVILSIVAPQLCPENKELLDFINETHDLGMVPLFLKRRDIKTDGVRNYQDHGSASVELLSQWGALDIFPEHAQAVVRYAIEHHADKDNPAYSESGSVEEQLQYVFACLLRDCDKYAIYQETDAYLRSPDRKRQEIKHWNMTGEQYAIDPEHFIETFMSHRVPVKQQMRSYESYMLYFCSWIYNVNLVETLRKIVESGAIDQLAAYFLQQLPDDQSKKIVGALDSYLRKFDLSLNC